MPEGIISFKCPFLYKDSAEGTANYEKVFSKVANAKDEMMVGQLKEIALRRSQLADALKTITPASSIAQLDAAQKTVEETIPFLYAVAQAVEKNPNVKRVGKLVFTWVSACEAKNEVKMCENAWSDVGMAVVVSTLVFSSSSPSLCVSISHFSSSSLFLSFLFPACSLSLSCTRFAPTKCWRRR
mmetsp:Transcript_18305/g.45849  ORF Transcript_18305/g.45849 Transcript_18305/m.45849 type:complete len:184 (+) Transcript_18305:139-690(+)